MSATGVAGEKKIGGMGAIAHEEGVAFRVWAPHADEVSVVGTFNDWKTDANPMQSEENGYWSVNIPKASIGDEYKFFIRNGKQEFHRMDPQAREVTNSVGNSVVANRDFDWEEDDFQIAPLNELVIYEMHLGTFGNESQEDIPAGFEQAIQKLSYLKQLGVNCIELMPVSEFAGDYSWGYNPAHIFAVESAYGGPQGFKHFIREAHRHGIAVILDVVYNHFGPSDLGLWQFDGWSENSLGGIYFYNDWRSDTPWGNTRPDYGRGEVRQFIFDNAMMWLNEYHVDGLRYDMTLYIRSVSGPESDLPDGWSLTQWINSTIREQSPGKIVIAEDLQNNSWITKTDGGGACFHTQWDAKFVHPIRRMLSNPTDEGRSLEVVKAALFGNFNGDPFQRVIYTESHDEVANGKSRMPSEIKQDAPEDWFAEKRATLGAVLVLTAPGVPMLFQGQEFLESGWFRDTIPLDWDKTKEFDGVVRMFQDLIALRLNRQGQTRGLTGANLNMIYEDEAAKVLVYHRWFEHGVHDDVIVVTNFCRNQHNIQLTLPTAGHWKLMFNGDSKVYSERYNDTPAADINFNGDESSGIDLMIGPYSALVYALERT